MSDKKHTILIGCVGKPNAGKSSFLNACTDAKAKVGNYPFTTIDPNHGIAYYSTPCPCSQFNLSDRCSPRYGMCVNGTRFIPVKVLDVAGLIPGASEGLGLGNKFLDDLRTASVLLHVIDVSGTTNEKGESTEGYDPIKDVEWLQLEIHNWIFHNLWKKWGGIVRKQTAAKLSIAEAIQLQLSGYGTRLPLVEQVLSNIGIKDGEDLVGWDEEMVHKLVWEFMKIRFPTILVLNKIDLPSSDKNITKICRTYPDDIIVPSSALAECFLRRLKQQNFIHYIEGSEFFDTHEEETARGEPFGETPLKELDDKTKGRLEKIKDTVLFRFGSTGVHDAIKRAVEFRGMVPVYWVKNLNSFQSDRTTGVFRDCTLVKPGTTVREVFRMIYPDQEIQLNYTESTSGKRLGEGDLITQENNILKFAILVQKKD